MNIEALNHLNQFTGTDEYHRNPIGGMLYTDGVLYLAENAQAFWLIDAIASYQPQLRKNPSLAQMQFWTLDVDLQKHTAVLTCREDSEIPPAVTQNIEYTDFPLVKIELWVEGGILLLPNEH